MTSSPGRFISSPPEKALRAGEASPGRSLVSQNRLSLQGSDLLSGETPRLVSRCPQSGPEPPCSDLSSVTPSLQLRAARGWGALASFPLSLADGLGPPSPPRGARPLLLQWGVEGKWGNPPHPPAGAGPVLASERERFPLGITRGHPRPSLAWVDPYELPVGREGRIGICLWRSPWDTGPYLTGADS